MKANTGLSFTLACRIGVTATVLILGLFPDGTLADEIRLKDGKKLYGVIVAYEDNMFKVKTDFGYVLVEKDKIAAIVPSAVPASDANKETAPAARKDPGGKNASSSPVMESAVASADDAVSVIKDASAKTATPKLGNTAVHPSLPGNSLSSDAAAPAPAIKSATPSPTSPLAPSASVPLPPKEQPANREELQGNVYTNLTYGFQMYKAPSWNLLEDARSSLPNAIVALGTLDESTLMVVGREKSKEDLDAGAKAVEGRLREVYEDYRLLSQRKTTVSGLPAQEFHYRGKADGHMWSGTLLVLSRGSDIFTLLGMTYADTDLIQIQENVISRAIASFHFSGK